MRLLPIIGLEVHVQLKTNSKLFCACKNVGDNAPPNSSLCPICTGQPGVLPALNATAVELGVKIGLALGCTIPHQSVFDRKNYFYPDLPKGYQISQFHLPLATQGKLELNIPAGQSPRNNITVGITRAHLEEDAAKNFHAAKTSASGPITCVDFNRAGTPLLEIVSEPDLRTAQEAKVYLQELRAILRAIGASDADMEKGQMRCDANVSLLPVDDNNLPLQHDLNPKTEIKNLNSFRAVEHAITYEIKRQTELYAANTPPVGSTRGWDEDRGETFEQRLKETFADYRYFPEPDLPPQDLRVVRERVAATLMELPARTRARLIEEWWFSASDAAFLVGNDGWTEYAEHVLSELGAWLEATDTTDKSGGELLDERKKKFAKLVGGWLTSKLAGLLANNGLQTTAGGWRIHPEDFAEFILLLDRGAINSANAQKLLALMLATGDDPSHLMERNNLGQNVPEHELEEIVKQLVAHNPDQAAQVKAGQSGVIKWFVGSVMKATEGRASPQQAEELVKKKLLD